MADNIIFVLGSGRCGTTTLTKLFNLSNVTAMHEAKPRLWELCNSVYNDGCQNQTWERLLMEARSTYINSTTGTYIDINPKASVFLPAMKRLFPDAKFIVMWREFNETVKSLVRWGCYSKKDKLMNGRLSPPVDGCRKANAWYWVTIYEFILKHLPSDAFFFPFSWIKNYDIVNISGFFENLLIDIPDAHAMNKVLMQKCNSGKTDRHIKKNWHEFDSRAELITERLMGV